MSTTFAFDRRNLRREHWLERVSAPLVEGRARFRIDHVVTACRRRWYAAGVTPCPMPAARSLNRCDSLPISS